MQKFNFILGYKIEMSYLVNLYISLSYIFINNKQYNRNTKITP